ncbi:MULTISPECIES: DUF2489 domain-containing protein [Glaesserella]|uniref:DUF2489 domain-containing protein n=1 Tax=Glaesserella australis TaxID=2094024 RepID=A0A328C1D8_9PAST|nr:MULTISPECIES: DUF2489 domain-containing protein [Glaesserella]AUI65393.1 coproporphyrinogen III oxidase [Glaesserella sp. 15-184]RAL19587.1 DUF2489 domain-containing protein [Glaesserella australis]
MLRFFLLILAILVLLSMAGYAFSLYWKLHQQKKQMKQAQVARYQSIIESIEIIAKAMLSEQCDLSEGVLRLKPLLDVLGKKLSTFPAMWALYQVVENMPILDARKNLKRNERMKLDLERELKEAELTEQIKVELQQLLDEVKQFKQELK